MPRESKKYSVLSRLTVFVVGTIVFSLSVSDSSADQVTTQNQHTSSLSPLPSPLTLDFVLSQVDDQHPVVQSAKARVDYQSAIHQQVISETGINAGFNAEARYIEPFANALDQRNNDSRMSLYVYKNLYDFGRSGAVESAALAELEGSEWLLKEVRDKHRINLMAAFFDVLLADLTYIRNNEALATSFIRFDRLRMRRDLGQYSDIAVLEAEKDYQSVRREFYRSRSRQQTSRAWLGVMMNRPGDLAAEIIEPEFVFEDVSKADVEALLKESSDNNFHLKALRKKVKAAEQQLEAARSGSGPTLKGRFELSEYAREIGNRSEVQASLIFDVPFWSGGAVQANTSKQFARLSEVNAGLRNEEMNVHQAVLETWHLLDTLRVERKEMATLIDFRDLYLDRSRALYEMEVKTDLGDSMVRISDARLKVAESKFKTALAQARLNALLGRPVYLVKEMENGK